MSNPVSQVSTILNVWSSPRNISTALMYSFAQRSDTRVVDEPLYAHYLLHTDSKAVHPGREEIIADQENDGRKVLQRILTDRSAPLLYYKQMTHHLIELNWELLAGTANILLIRDPRRIIASYSKVVERPTISDIGMDLQGKLYEFLKSKGALTAVVDSRLLLQNPKRVLRQLCERIGVAFEPEMLRWEAGARPEDGIWAPYWYDNVHRSTGFQLWTDRQVELSPELEELAEQCRPVYEDLLSVALR